MKWKILYQLIIMSRYAFFCLVTHLCLSSLLIAKDGLAQKSIDEIEIDLSARPKSVREIFKEIEAKTDFRFVYLASDLAYSESITFLPNEKTLGEILRRIASKTELGFKRINNTINVNIRINNDNKLPAVEEELSDKKQQVKIAGKVISLEDGEPLPGVSILVKGSSVGTTTDFDGNYLLNVTTDATLQFSYIGYQTQEILVGNQTTINVSMELDLEQLQEIVVVGYGVQQKDDLTGSVATVNSKAISNRQSIQLSDALQGTMAGVTVTRSGGGPGATSTVRIRGVTSLNVNDPLVIIDGVPGLGLNDINPNDVESISVLKDAASQAIYGARAAAGVILVTTKRGKEGTLQVSYDYEFGSSTATRMPEFVDAQTYRRLANERSTNDGGGNIFDPAETDNYLQLNANDPDLYPNTNWQDEMLDQSPTTRQRHDLSIAIGNEKVKTRASLSYVTEDGLYVNNNYDRYTFRVNNNLKINKILEANIDLYYKRTTTLNPSQEDEDIIALARRYPGIFPARRTDGLWGEGKDGINPLAQTAEGGTLDEVFNQYSGILGFTLTPLEGLNVKVNFSPTFSDNAYDRFISPVIIPRQGSTTEFWPRELSSIEKRQTSITNLTRQVTINYSKKLGEHNLNFLAGYEEVGTDWEQIRTTSRNLSVDFRSLTFGDPLLTNNQQFASENALRSYFGRLAYDYKGKYLIQSNFRADASSRFAPDERWGFFPSISLGWVVSNESFDLPDVISFLKLRTSYGEVGNERIGNTRTGGQEFFNFYPYQGLFETSNVIFYDGNFVSGLGIRQDFLADEFIRWETTKTIDVGLDLGLFNDHFSLAVDYYQKNTEDIILTLDIPNYLGFEDNTKTNVGAMEVKGLDVELGYRNAIGELTYSVNVNASSVTSEITNVGGREDFTSEQGTKINILGSEFNEWFGYQTFGLYQTQQEADEYGVNAQAGDVWLVDQLTVDTNGDGIADERDNVINEQDRLPLGGSLPRVTYGGNINMGYKGFDLALVFNGVAKQNRRYEGFQVRPFSQTFGNVPAVLMGNYWSPTNSTQQNQAASYPRFSGRSESFNYRVSDFWLFNGGYFRLQNVTLGYTLPTSITQKVKLNNLRMYVALRDFVTVAPNFLEGWDPEVDDQGYPIMRSILVGLNVRL